MEKPTPGREQSEVLRADLSPNQLLLAAKG